MKTKDIQSKLNAFTKEYLRDVTPLREDGDFGHASRKRLRMVKYYLGYTKEKRDNRSDAEVSRQFLNRLGHPNKPRYSSKTSVDRGKARRKNQRALAEQQQKDWREVKGFKVWQGKTVPEWMIPWLVKSVEAGWRGAVVSGVRTPAYSEHLCFAMCGRPSCPGRCAGRSSNHNMLPTQGHPYGAIDVSDYANFAVIQRRIGSPLRNVLGAADPVHFSVSGN